MEILLVAGIVVCGWVFLCVLSGEREHRNRQVQAEAAAAAKLAAENPPSPAGHGEKLTMSGRATKV